MKIEVAAQYQSIGKRIDFHTHIIPDMDDGSRSIEMSIQMIETSVKDGVCCIALTPHFYPSRDNPEHFFKKRDERIRLLKSKYCKDTPTLLTGAEVQYFEGITAMADLPKMRIESTNALLVEMPMCTWSSRMVGDIEELSSRREYRIVLAHVERYLGFGNISAVRHLASRGVMMQISSGAFSNYFERRQMLRLYDEGLLHILGSDCHNTTTRPPNLALAYDVIEKKRGEDAVREIVRNGFELFENMTLNETTVSQMENTYQ